MRARILVAFVGTTSVACGGSVAANNVSLDAGDSGDNDDSSVGDASADATNPRDGASDSSVGDAASDAMSLGDVGLDAPSEAAPDAAVQCDHQLSTPTCWATFDTTTVSQVPASFAGGTFDGRYVYFAPSTGGGVARYDTQAPFALSSSWSIFDTTSLTARAKGFMGAAFNGRYLYLVPHDDSVAVRFDTQASFGDGASWNVMDVATAVSSTSFAGAAFDGKYMYFAPNTNGVMARLDTTAAIFANNGTAWQSFNITSVDSNAGGFVGAVFDGRYVYFAPAGTGPRAVARYDTQGVFTEAAAWQTFTQSVPWVQGAGFDGHNVYFVAHHTAGGMGNQIERYDSAGAFTNASSWTVSALNLNPAVDGFFGTAFDGRYLYAVPSSIGNHVLARYDTQAPFTAMTSWSSFDLTPFNQGGISGFAGAVFDGEYVYFIPVDGKVVRFDARPTHAMPALPGFFGSFF